MQMIEKLRSAVFDTHVWVWMSCGEQRSESLRGFIGTPVVSAISVWEVSMLAAKGRLSLDPTPLAWIEQNLRHPIALEPIHPSICVESSLLADFHDDPADRMIVATAMVLGLPLITADRKIIDWNRNHALIQVVAL